MSSEKRICPYCDKAFKSVYNCDRHIKICKKNTNKPIEPQVESTEKILLDSTELLLREQIDFLKEQIKIKDEQIMSLLDKLNFSSSKPINQNISKKNKEQEQSISLKIEENQPQEQLQEQPQVQPQEEVKSTPIKLKLSPQAKYIRNDCKDAYTISNFIEEIEKKMEIKDFSRIALSSYEKKYIETIKIGFENIPKYNYPIQITNKKKGSEEGYVKLENGFQKFHGNELMEQIKIFINGKGKQKGIKNILLNKIDDYKLTQNYRELKDEDQSRLYFSIMGMEDNEDGKSLEEKKITQLIRHVMDCCIVSF
jgi:hypothetical protein